MVEVDNEPQRGNPEYVRIAEHIRWMVAQGQLKAGDRLEPVRALAGRLGVDPGTVARAYRLLEQQGVVEAHGRRGTRVVTGADSAPMRGLRETRLSHIMERTLVEALAQGFSLDEIDAAFSLHVTAWRQRRLSTTEPQPSPAGEDCLHCFAGSHDVALETLWQHARRSHPQDIFTAQYVGSLEGLLRLLRGAVGLAGAHMLDLETGQYNVPILRRLFVGKRLSVITLAEREQGLILAPGNPKQIASLTDLARPDVRFVNRQAGSGTRALLDYRLGLLGVTPQLIAGYADEVDTHTAVADRVARGLADAGLGLYAAARAFGLAWVPVARERYDLVTLAEWRQHPPLSWLLDIVSSSEFKTIVGALGGYDTTHTGEEMIL